ncbi:MAG: PIG-L deacetylase family protein [Bacteroidota bacterium]|nr:PIG-L deacetylase family protein [Bacteroidota bacterium]
MTPYRLFCIFPHPDDESFLMGGSIAACTQSGDAEVSLYTLTRGERSRNAAAQNLRPEEIAALRSREVVAAAEILGISQHRQGNYPDGGLRDIDPRVLERDITDKIRTINPHVLCTFDIQGGSVHPDHITMHHVVKRVFLELREENSTLQRLCFCVLPRDRVAAWPRAVFGVERARIDAVIPVGAYREIEQAAVRAHYSVRRDVEENNFDNWMFWEEEYFSFYGEEFQPAVQSLFHGLHR